MNLKKAQIVGFFSLPTSALAEHNPMAYTIAMQHMPPGAGACSHCGNGIIHHVVVRDENGKTSFIGTTCAEKVGLDRESIRLRLTSEEKAARDERRKAWRDEQKELDDAWEEHVAAHVASRMEIVGDIVRMLEEAGGEFYNSLANQLRYRKLSPAQSSCVARMTSATGRRNKKNAEAWDAIFDLCHESGDDLGSFYDFRKQWLESRKGAA